MIDFNTNYDREEEIMKFDLMVIVAKCWWGNGQDDSWVEN
jgi:hypothetical protein